MPNAARIDVHTHVVPPFWGEALPSHGGDPSGWAIPSWSPEVHLAYTDDQQIATSVLSLADVPGPLVDYAFDTTRTAVQTVFAGVPDRYLDVKIILAHAGGFVPCAAMRICDLQPALDPDGPTTGQLPAKFKRFYWDTALSSGPDAFPSFLASADHNRILFGSDFPYAPAPVPAAFNQLLDTRSGLTDEQKTAFNHDNAKKIFRRLT
jgi:aminocarboxymuconate-semialdehyde decarboxylase